MKTMLITGGANGIGKSIVEKFKSDYNVIVIDKDIKTINKLKKEHKEVRYYHETVTNYPRIKKIIDEIYLKYNNIDVLINNAAIQTVDNISKLSIQDWKEVIEVNLTANFYITQLVSNRMRNGSTILNITSTHFNKPRTDHPHYDISKSGVTTLTKLFALELACRDITINALAIGATYTDMNKDFNIKAIENNARNRIPMKHICTPDEISNYVYNIISNFSSETTGSIFVIDGGRNLHE